MLAPREKHVVLYDVGLIGRSTAGNVGLLPHPKEGGLIQSNFADHAEMLCVQIECLIGIISFI